MVLIQSGRYRSSVLKLSGNVSNTTSAVYLEAEEMVEIPLKLGLGASRFPPGLFTS